MNTKSNKMATMPIPKLVLNMSLPAILAMTVQALYNIVDSYFVAKDTLSGLTAVSLAFPIQMIIVALSVGIGVGINSCVSRNLGAHNEEDAINTAEHGLVLTMCLYLILLLLGLFAVDLYIPLFTSDPAVITSGIAYTKIVLIFSFSQMLAQSIISILQGTGDMVSSMYVQLTGAIANCILDPIMIFGLFGCPALHVAGAAYATVIGQFLSLLLALFLLYRKRDKLPISLRTFKFRPSILTNIIRIGLPSAVMQAVGSVMVTGMNLILSQFGDAAITVMGIYFKLQSFAFMPLFGMNQGVLPILSFNYGAQIKSRFMQARRFATNLALGYTLIALAVFQLFPEQLMAIFSAEGEIMALGIVSLRILSLAFPIAAISISRSPVFQSLERASITMITSILRQLGLLLPLSWLLFKLFGAYVGWLAFPIAELIATIYNIVMYRKVKVEIIDRMPDMAEEVAV